MHEEEYEELRVDREEVDSLPVRTQGNNPWKMQKLIIGRDSKDVDMY